MVGFPRRHRGQRVLLQCRCCIKSIPISIEGTELLSPVDTPICEIELKLYAIFPDLHRSILIMSKTLLVPGALIM